LGRRWGGELLGYGGVEGGGAMCGGYGWGLLGFGINGGLRRRVLVLVLGLWIVWVDVLFTL
jgi:hypothetical protein